VIAGVIQIFLKPMLEFKGAKLMNGGIAADGSCGGRWCANTA
jgi:hypothetical protein